MNDLDLLREFRAEVAPPEQDVVARAYQSMFDEGSGRGVPPKHRRRVRRWSAVGAIGAAAVAVAVAVPVLLPGGSPGGADPAAARVLRHVAHVAARGVATPPPEVGQYVYTKSRNDGTSTYVPGNGLAAFSVEISSTREAWIGPDGSGRLLETHAVVGFPTSADRGAWVAAGSPNLGEGPSDETYGPDGMHYLDLRNLPTDPGQLQTLIEARKIEGGPPGNAETFTIIGDLLRETYASPQLRAALYEVAANLPGVEYVGDVTDAAGRPGIAVAYTHDGERDELIFDPGTSQLLAERDVLVEQQVDPSNEPGGTLVSGAGSPGTVLFEATYLVSRIVDSTNQRP